jgi:LysM repeat protein
VDDFVKSLKTKWGPLPAWVYGLLLVGGAYAWYWWKNKHAATGNTTTETTADTAQADGASYSADAPGYGINDNGTGIGAGGSTGGTTTVPDNSQPTTNLAWQTLATSFLVGMGYPATQVEQALNNWLLGLQATSQDSALFNLAVSRWGQPPEGVPPQPTNTTVPSPGLPGGTTQPPGSTPPKTTPKPPVTHTYYTVRRGDNLTAIAHKFGISESTLYANNKAAIEADAKKHGHDNSNNGNLIFAGLKLTIK